MQHRYVGDVGDFGKYGLLRALCRGMTLGVNWYLNQVQEHNNDGRHVGYLNLNNDPARARACESFRVCDVDLYDRLRELRQTEVSLNLKLIQQGGILSNDTIYFSAPVPEFSEPARTRQARLRRSNQRDIWHRTALDALNGACCVFIDPDNGFDFRTLAELGGKKPSCKHSYWHEVSPHVERGQSVVVYHHFHRASTHQDQITECLGKIRARLDQVPDREPHVWAVRYRRGTGRAFFIMPSEQHLEAFRERTNQYVATWHEHATVFGM